MRLTPLAGEGLTLESAFAVAEVEERRHGVPLHQLTGPGLRSPKAVYHLPQRVIPTAPSRTGSDIASAAPSPQRILRAQSTRARGRTAPATLASSAQAPASIAARPYASASIKSAAR